MKRKLSKPLWPNAKAKLRALVEQRSGWEFHLRRSTRKSSSSESRKTSSTLHRSYVPQFNPSNRDYSNFCDSFHLLAVYFQCLAMAALLHCLVRKLNPCARRQPGIGDRSYESVARCMRTVGSTGDCLDAS